MTALSRILIAAGLLAAATLLSDWRAAAQGASEPAAPPPAIEAPSEEAPASQSPRRDVTAPLSGWNAALARLSERLEAQIAGPSALEEIRGELDDISARIDGFIAEESPRLPNLEARLDKLGAKPKDGDPPEPEAVTLQREELSKEIGDLSGALKAANEARLRIENLSDRAREVRRDLFEKRLFERERSPLSPALWRDIAKDAPIGFTRIGFMLNHWWEALPDRDPLIVLTAAAFAVWALLSWLSYRRINQLRDWPYPDMPAEWRRTASAGRVILLRSLPALVACGFFYAAMLSAGLFSATSERLAVAAMASLIIIATVQAVSKTALAVNRPKWRLLALSNHAAQRLHRLLMVLAVVYGIDFFLSSLSQIAFIPFSVSLGQSFLASMLIAGLILSILRIRDNGRPDRPPRRIGPAYVRLPLWLVAIAILAAALIGYVSLSRFIAGQLIVASTIVIIAYLLIIWVSAFGQSLSDDKSIPGAWLAANFRLDQRRREQIALPLILLLKAAIVVGAIPLILLLWGFDWYDVGSWLRQALFGFEVGGIKVSISAILAALALFFAGYVAAKFFQSWLDGYVLERAGLETGVRDSIRTTAGYIGVTLAALLAVSYAGLDFSSLAIVAGALSVGIGFGLQSIVNNFVSGLILLAERPIKVGDWVILGTQEGIVRKISVRSTEIETFDRANLIVPNSMLITDMVKNWTLHNEMGRMPIPVGVHYSSDPEQVRDILLEVAQQHPQVLSNPAPFVFFENFGPSSLDFILFVYLTNINRSYSVRTDLRIAILKAFRRNGIEIPYPQTDVHFRDIDWIRKVITERGRGAGGKAAPMTVRDYEAGSQSPDEGDGGPGNGGGQGY